MSALYKFLIGLILLAVLGSFGLYFNMIPAGSIDGAEAKLRNSANQALDEAGADWASLRMDGQQVILSGTAPSVEAVEEAKKTIQKSNGGGALLGGVTSIDTSGVSIAEQPAEAAEPAAPHALVVSPYVWSASWEGPGAALFLAGYAPDEATRDKILNAAQKLFPDGIVDEMQIAEGAPFDGWGDAAVMQLQALAALDHGQIEASNRVFRLSGQAVSKQSKTNIEQDLSQFTEGGMAIVAIEAPQNPDVSLDLSARIDRCQKEFNELLAQNKVSFTYGSAEIAPASAPVLERLVQIARGCDNMIIQIISHSDNDGEEAALLRLTQMRAEAVRKFFLERGFDEDFVQAQGVGFARPAADNSTAAGRAKNRRIEIRVFAP
jgi:OmpA-OmpF porin, OOP family